MVIASLVFLIGRFGSPNDEPTTITAPAKKGGRVPAEHIVKLVL